MSDVSPPKDAFEKMMAASRTATATPETVAADEEDEPVRTAVLYEAWLEHADESEPLWRVPYFGQVVRVGTAEAIFAARKRKHETDAAREDKDLGLHAVIDRFGPDAMAWRIVSYETGPRTAMQELANAEEIRLIGEHGGILRDMDAKLEQTLNLTKGGKWGDARAVWEAIDARRRRALNRFKAAMAKYVAENGSVLVPTAYIDDDGYRLGRQLSSFRQGQMRKGMPDEADINGWANALPNWYWDARESDEYRKGFAQRSKDQAANETAEKKADRLAKLKQTMATDASKAKRRKIATAQREKEVRAELERARLIVVPFEKSKKRRAEMRAASEHTKPSGKRGENVLYMISEDGETIRRVKPDGDMGKQYIVGPVVDPPPPDAFGSD
tara:strand:+ start:41 stop:1198 length:1158 start_codon:yes stop_codon:yes gene_type:complete